MEAPAIITLQCRPLHSHAVPSRCDGRSDLSDGNGSYSREEREWESGPVEDVPRSSGSRYHSGTGGRSRVAPAIASLYDPSESSSQVDSFASSSYPTGRDCLDSEGTMSVRQDHSSAFTQHHDDDNIAQQDEDVTDIAVVVAEQWVACVHCAGDNPPYAHRCEVCFGSLTGTS